MQEYVPKEIEEKWQKYWEEHNLLDFAKDSENPKYSENSHSQQQHKYSDQILCERMFCVRRYSNISDNSDKV
jgi:leucyl-tRNA synthetase